MSETELSMKRIIRSAPIAGCTVSRDDLKRLFDITVTLAGTDGEMHLARADRLLDYPLAPGRLEAISFISGTSFMSRFNQEPLNRFEVLLIFKKPDLLNFTIAPSEPTPNNSNVNITSNNDTWSHGVFQKVRNYIQERSNGRKFIHRSNFYDLALLVIGLPFAFYAAFRLEPVINYFTAQAHPMVGFAAYIYLFVVAIWIFRLGFNYTK